MCKIKNGREAWKWIRSHTCEVVLRLDCSRHPGADLKRTALHLSSRAASSIKPIWVSEWTCFKSLPRQSGCCKSTNNRWDWVTRTNSARKLWPRDLILLPSLHLYARNLSFPLFACKWQGNNIRGLSNGFFLLTTERVWKQISPDFHLSMMHWTISRISEVKKKPTCYKTVHIFCLQRVYTRGIFLAIANLESKENIALNFK